MFCRFEVEHFIWPGNSPDLNTIELAWSHLKQKTTSKGASRYCLLMEFKWQDKWLELEQRRIQAWIERILHHLEQVRLLQGGNEYKEGRNHALVHV